ncbi:MAG: hypothetical protein FH751_17075 [Firmicutes bacterium]|nr:hypothetical protein [Bacillota bacterium]
MENKDQLRQIALRCSQFRNQEGDINALRSESNVLGETTKSCEICNHFVNNRCQLNLIDEISSNIDVKLD